MSAADPDLPPRPLPQPALLAAVAVGGALGALGRYGLTGLLPPRHGLPIGTLLTNLAGCLALGLLVGARPDARWLRPFVGTGMLGGFTTFSTYAVETDRLVTDRPAVALGYLAATTVGGLAAAALGLRAGGRVVRR